MSLFSFEQIHECCIICLCGEAGMVMSWVCSVCIRSLSTALVSREKWLNSWSSWNSCHEFPLFASDLSALLQFPESSDMVRLEWLCPEFVSLIRSVKAASDSCWVYIRSVNTVLVSMEEWHDQAGIAVLWVCLVLIRCVTSASICKGVAQLWEQAGMAVSWDSGCLTSFCGFDPLS